MKTSIKKFLEFQGYQLYFTLVKGEWLIAVKPICEVLGIEFTRQLKTLKSDKILAGVWALEPMHDISGRLQKMVCLPEFYIYGWIFGIQSKKESLIKYKWECYKVLFDHFHGSITQRSKFLNLKSKQQAEIERLEAILMENKDYQKLQECRNQIKAANNSLSKLDHELIHGQMSLQFGNEN